MIDIATFRVPQLTAAATAMTIAFIAITGSWFLIIQSLQIVKGCGPLAAALATAAPITVVNFVLMPRAPALTERFGEPGGHLMGRSAPCRGPGLPARDQVVVADRGGAGL